MAFCVDPHSISLVGKKITLRVGDEERCIAALVFSLVKLLYIDLEAEELNP